MRPLLYIITVGVFFAMLEGCEGISRHPLVIIISFDGFRFDYTQKTKTPTLDYLKQIGSYSTYMKNVFMTKTFPNHHSIATGLYPENHGIVSNKAFDPKYGRILNNSYEFWDYSDDVTPIWTLNEKEGGGRHSGVMMWPGGEFKYQGIQPTFYKVWNDTVSWQYRVDTVLRWFHHPVTPINLAMLYFEEPDELGHGFGPDSKMVIAAIQKLDNISNYLIQELKLNNLSDQIDIFLMSDHGMEAVTEDRIIDLRSYLDNSTYMCHDDTPVLHFWPNEGMEDVIYKTLKNVSLHEKFSVYRKNEIPYRWHYNNSRRTSPIIAVADEKYAFHDMYRQILYMNSKYNISPSPSNEYGVHGYDNEEPNMHPFFMAWGPHIKQGHRIAPFSNIDLYPLFCELLQLPTPSNNGSLAAVKGLLRQDETFFPVVLIALVGIFAVGGVIGTGILAATFLKKKHKENVKSMAYRKTRRGADDAENRKDYEEEQHLLVPCATEDV